MIIRMYQVVGELTIIKEAMSKSRAAQGCPKNFILRNQVHMCEDETGQNPASEAKLAKCAKSYGFGSVNDIQPVAAKGWWTWTRNGQVVEGLDEWDGLWENWGCLNWLRFERCTQLERELHSNKVGVLQTGSWLDWIGQLLASLFCQLELVERQGERENQMESKVEELERSVTVKDLWRLKLGSFTGGNFLTCCGDFLVCPSILICATPQSLQVADRRLPTRNWWPASINWRERFRAWGTRAGAPGCSWCSNISSWMFLASLGFGSEQVRIRGVAAGKIRSDRTEQCWGVQKRLLYHSKDGTQSRKWLLKLVSYFPTSCSLFVNLPAEEQSDCKREPTSVRRLVRSCSTYSISMHWFELVWKLQSDTYNC